MDRNEPLKGGRLVSTEDIAWQDQGFCKRVCLTQHKIPGSRGQTKFLVGTMRFRRGKFGWNRQLKHNDLTGPESDRFLAQRIIPPARLDNARLWEVGTQYSVLA